MADLAPDPRALAARERKEAAANVRWVIRVNGQGWEFRLSEMTAAEYGALKRGPGMTPGEAALGAMQGDFECFAAAWWLARRQCGERDLDWAETADSLSYDDEWFLEFADTEPAEEAVPDPQP